MTMTMYLIPFVIVGFVIAVTTDQYQLIHKLKGKKQEMIASGYNHAMQVMVLNRFGAVLYFAVLAFLIDTGIHLKQAFQVFIIALIFSLILLIFISRRAFNQRLILKVSYDRYYYFSIIANFLNLLGLTCPALIAILFFDFRLTASHTGFIFNTFFMFINVFLLEKKLASVIDKNSNEYKMIGFNLIMGRITGYILVFTIFLMIYLGM